MIILLIGLLLAALAVQRYSLEHVLDRLAYRMELDRKLVEPDEAFEIKTTVENHKRMMVPFLRICERVPQELVLVEGDGLEKAEGRLQTARIASECYLAGHQKAVFLRKASIGQRGWYGFSGATVIGGDFLGMAEKSMEVPRSLDLVVKPRIVEEPRLDEALGGFLGEVSVRRFWMEDPMFLSGYRDYTGREPMKNISWTMSARNNKLMVKEFDHTAEANCTVLLDISNHAFWEIEQEDIELCFSLARTVCEKLEKQGFTYGFLTNAVIGGPVGHIRELPQGRGPMHLEGILEALGRATSHFSEHLEDLLWRVLGSRTPGRACILISLAEAEECSQMIARVREVTGYEVLVLGPAVLRKMRGKEGEHAGIVA